MLEAPPKEKSTVMNRISKKRFFLIFIGVIVVTLGAIYALIGTTLSHWDSNRVAQLIAVNIHRQVKLGKYNWQLGLDGIEFKFASVEINELNGAPFIHSGESQFSLAITPLLRGQFFPKSLVFQNPEIWAVKIKSDKWNFSDLPNVDTTKYISRVLVLGGKLHVVDKSGSTAKNLDGLNVQNIKFSLNRPFGWLAWPFSLTCDIPETKFDTKISASGVGSGRLGDWSHSNHKWNVKVTGFDPKELTILGIAPNAVSVPIDFQLNGSGNLSKELKTSLAFENPDLSAQIKELRLKGNFGNFIPGLQSGASTPVLSRPTAEEVGNSNKNAYILEAELDRLLSGPFKGLSTTAQLSDASIKLKKTALNAYGVSAKFLIKDGQISTETPVHSNFADGAVDISGKYNSARNFSALIHLTSANFGKISKLLASNNIYRMAPQLTPVAGTVKSANLTVTGGVDRPHWQLSADPTGIFYKSPKEDKLIALNGGTFNLDESKFKFTNITGLLGASTPFKLNGTGSVVASEPIALNAVAQNVDLGSARKLLAVLAVKLPASPADKMEGTCKQTDITLTGTQVKPALSLKGTIKQIYVQDKNKTRTFELNSGDFKFEKEVFSGKEIKGAIGKGTFSLDGKTTMTAKPKLDVVIKAKDIDLSNVKVVLQDLKMDSPLLAEELLAGRVDDLDAHILGTIDKPDITATLVPGDVEFEPLGAERPIHLKGGKVDVDHDDLKVDNVAVSTPRGSLIVSLTLEDLSKTSVLSRFAMKSSGMDIGDLNAYLVAERTPPMVRERYIDVLKSNQISEPKGKMSGHMNYTLNTHTNAATINGQIHVAELSSVVNGFAVQDVSGNVQAADNNLTLTAVHGAVGKSRFGLRGTLTDFTNVKTRVWKVDLFSRISMQELSRLAGDASASADAPGVQPVKIAAHIVGPEPEKVITFTAQLDPAAAITFNTVVGPIAKPPGNEARLDGSMAVKADMITLNNTHLKFGDVVLEVSGSVDSTNITAKNLPKVEIKVRAADFVPLKTLVGFAPGIVKPELVEGITGTIRGGMTAAGPADKLKIKGGAEVKNFALPKFKISQVNGKFRADDWVSLSTPGGDAAVGQIPVSFDVPSARLEKLNITNIKGKLVSAPNQTWQYQADANISKGTLKLTGVIAARTATCKAKLTNISADDLLRDLMAAPNELTGTMACAVDLACNNLSANPLQAWSGAGTTTLTNGKVSRFSLLEKRITQANLLKSGFLGFNLNNLIASVAPVEKGEFKSITTKFNVQTGVLHVNEMLFEGDELRLRAKGKVDLSKRNMHFEISGRIPRVSSQGPLGAVAPLLGVSGIKHTVEDIPELFFMGKKSTSETSSARVFAFSAKAPLDKPDAMAQSIYKSFHWLQGSGSASAHPVLDVDAEQVTTQKQPDKTTPAVPDVSGPDAESPSYNDKQPKSSRLYDLMHPLNFHRLFKVGKTQNT